VLDDPDGNIGQSHEPEPFDAPWHEALSAGMKEWTSPEDDEAFRDL
jgi:hypothetical protein